MFSGLVWTGEQAVQVGIADEIGDINTLKRKLKLDKTKDYTIRNNGLNALFGSSFNSIGHSIGLGISDSVKQQTYPEIQ